MLRRFHEIFGIQDDLRKEQSRFVERIDQTAFDHIQSLDYRTPYEKVFRNVCYCLGVNADDRISRANQGYFQHSRNIPSLRSLTGGEFTETLKVLVLLYDVLEGVSGEQETLTQWIEIAFSHATADLGVTWNQGMFYPSGAPELDRSLIEEALEWLRDFPNERADYLKALTGYANKRLDEVIINCYVAVESMARTVLSNSKTLENNREGLVKKLGLSQTWKSLLSNFISYANEFERHASENRHSLNPIEVEGFLYMSGLLLRMAIHSTRARATLTRIEFMDHPWLECGTRYAGNPYKIHWPRKPLPF